MLVYPPNIFGGLTSCIFQEFRKSHGTICWSWIFLAAHDSSYLARQWPSSDLDAPSTVFIIRL